MLLNLFVNAWHAMPDGGDLYLKTENLILDENSVRPYKVKPGCYVRLTVADTGVGIDKADMDRIFEPFFTTKEMGRGTGLGLASVYGIVKGHGGYINVYSEKGQGIDLHRLPAGHRAAGGEAEVRHAPATVRRARRRFCWSTTRRWCSTSAEACWASSATR